MNLGKQPAFPQGAHWGTSQPTPEGMTMREWYAGLAMQGLCRTHWSENFSMARARELYAPTAEHAVAIADALIAELEKGTA